MSSNKSKSTTEKINALAFRQSLGSILDKVGNEQCSYVIEKNQKQIAVLVPYDLYKKRFYDLDQQDRVKNLLERFRNNSVKSKLNSVQVLRSVRYGDDN